MNIFIPNPYVKYIYIHYIYFHIYLFLNPMLNMHIFIIYKCIFKTYILISKPHAKSLFLISFSKPLCTPQSSTLSKLPSTLVSIKSSHSAPSPSESCQPKLAEKVFLFPCIRAFHC